MLKRIERLRTNILVSSSIISVLMFALSGVLYKILPWISNLLMGIGASFLASILFALFSEATKKKYTILSAETKAKKYAVSLYWKNIDLGYGEAKQTYRDQNYQRAVSWVGYFYEKILATCSCLEGIRSYDGKLKNDSQVINFIFIANRKYEDYLCLCDSKRSLGGATKELAELALKNMEECYEHYNNLYGSALHDAAQLEAANNKYYFE